MTISRIALKSPAKINLFLHVEKNDKYGFHPLKTIMCPLRFGDFIDIQKSHKIALDIENDKDIELQANKQNLCYQALQAICETAQLKLTPHIQLQKNIPLESGLGGGSSNAACLLNCLDKLYNLNLDSAILIKLASQIGKDVPFFLQEGPCYMEGYGDRVNKNIFLPSFYILLVYPKTGLSTKKIFDIYDKSGFSSRTSLTVPQKFSNFEDFINFLKTTRNDLEKIAIKECPDTKSALHEISSTNGVRLSRMSGSGSSCFGIYPTKKEALAGQIKIQNKFKHWKTYVTSPLYK